MGASHLLLSLVAAVFSVGYSHPAMFQCSRYCKEDWNKFGYEIGNSYVYSYRGSARTAVNATTNHGANAETSTTFAAKVQISVLSACDFVMQLSDIDFEETYIDNVNAVIRSSPEKNREFGKLLAKNSLHFSFTNGRIDTVCPSEDGQGVVNVKRAILSAFQNSMPNLENDAVVYETDVSGNCETRYEIEEREPRLVVRKIKNLEACSHRKSRHMSWLTVPYAKNSNNKNYVSVLRSSQTCTQKFNEELILNSNECAEKHLFQPFSNGENGAVTYLTQSLQFKGKLGGIVKSTELPKNFRYESLLAYQETEKEKGGKISNVLKILQHLESKTADGVEPSVPKLFSTLAHELQNLDHTELLDVFWNIKKSPRQKKFVLDAMSLVTTVDGVETMKSLYKDEEISHSQMNSWLSSVVFVKDVSLSIIESVTPLLESNKAIRQKATLTLSSLVYSYCKEDNRCFDKPQIRNIVKIITEPLTSTCVPRNPENHNEILLSLKAIGNIGVPSSVENLKTCFSNNDTPMELRLAAIAGHRRITCTANENLENFEDYFADIHENTEIRIAFYLASMQCASYATFARIKDVLRTEETNQVGSFVWTHLTNLQESSSPWKSNLKSLVENEFLRNKFSTDMRKYSRNYEISTFFDSINAGATMESNVVFTSESYLPKSAMLNFTLDLFGEAINIFEVGARMEGFEQVFENLFGPEGYFPEESIRSVLETVRAAQNKSQDKLQELRNSFASQTTYKEPNGLLYAKMFGNEISYTRFKNVESLIGGQVNSGSILEALMKLFRQQDIDYTNSFVFLDSSYRIPTVLGFPLELAVNGTATVGLTVKGKMELKDLWAHKMSVEGKIYPSAAIEVVGTMTIDSLVSRTGLRSENTLNSNTYLDGHAHINKGKLVDLKLNVPKKQINIITVESRVFLVQGDEAYPMADVTDNVENVEVCTKRMFNTITGLEFCYSLHYVNASVTPEAPYFPLTGRFKYSMDIKKTDEFDSYELTLKTHTEIKNYRPIYSMSLYIDTPNSSVNRKIAISYLVDCEKLSLNAALTSPFVNLEVNSKIGDDYDNLGFLLQTKLNNNEIIMANTSLKSTKYDETWLYVPSATITYKNRQIASLSGNVNYLPGAKYSADLHLETHGYEPVKVTGDVHLRPEKFELAASITSKYLSGKTEAVVVKKPESISILAKTVYDYKDFKQQVLDVHLKAHSLRKGTLAEESVYLSVNSTQKPLYNTLLSFTNQRDKLYLESKAVLTLFGMTWNAHQLLKFWRTSSENDMGLKFSLQCLQRNIDYNVDLSYVKSDNIFKIHGLLQLSRAQRLESLISYNMIPERNRTLELLLYFPKQLWAINGVFNQQSEKQYTIFLHGFYEMEEEKRSLLSLSGEYTNSTVAHFQNHTLTGTITTPSGSSWLVSSSLQISPDMFLNTIQLRSGNDIYVSHITWTEDSFTGLMQSNEKQILMVNGFKGPEEISVSFGFNIYQHFELAFKLLLPYRKFQFVLFWDKDRDVNQKLALLVDHHATQGLYLVDLEYPNQKVTASFVLLPTQVTMNVTWGLDASKRIYLKAGNKVYDIGGIWFAKLETPFEYLETQEFKLSYYALPQNAELKLDVSWRDQQINLIMSGIKSVSRVSGYLELNTSLPEISKISVAVSHSHNTTNGILRVKNDATFVFNAFQITGQSLWKSQGANISSSFEIVSPSNSIEPIIGSLIVNNNHTMNHFSGFVNWKHKRISVDYHFQNSQSYIRIKTPFEGLEVTELDYTIIGEADKLVLEVRINLLTHLNHALLSWNNEGHASSVKFEVTCPIIGSYKIIFKHSTIFGHLEEYLVITQGLDNDILAVKLYGDLVPILMMDVKASIKLLEHKASVSLKNNPNPLQSVLEARWDDIYVTSGLSVVFDEKEISDLNWNVKSSLLDGDISCVYTHENNSYRISAVLPKGYKFDNVLNLDDSYKWIDNVLNVDTPYRSGFLHYSHLIGSDNKNFDNRIIFRMNSNESRFTLNYNINDDLKFIDSASLKFITPWHHPITLNYSLLQEGSGVLKPSFRLEYQDKKMLEIKSSANIQYLRSEVQASVDVPFTEPFEIDAKYDFTQRTKTIDVVVTKQNTQFRIANRFFLEKLEATFSLNATVNGGNVQKNLMEVLLRYDFHKVVKSGSFKLSLPEQRQRIEVETSMSMENGINKINGKFLSTIEHWENVSAGFLLSLTTEESYLVFRRNNKALTAKYVFDKNISSGNLESKGVILITSQFENVKNCTLEVFYKANERLQELSVDLVLDQYTGALKANYEFGSHNNGGIQSVSVDGGLIIKYSKLLSENLLDVDIKTKGWIESKRSGSSLVILFTSNVPNLEKLNVQTSYEILRKGYNFKGTLTYNKDLYNVNHHLQHLPNRFQCWINFQTPPEVYGTISGNLFLTRSYNAIDAELGFVRNLQAYNVSLSSKYDILLPSSTVIKLNTPDPKYKAEIIGNFSLSKSNLKIYAVVNGNENQIQFSMDPQKRTESNLYVNLGSLQMTPWTLNSKYDVSKQSFALNLKNDRGISVEVSGGQQKLYVSFETAPNQKTLIVSGNHDFQSRSDLWFSYSVYFQDHKTKIDFVHKIDEQETKIFLDVSTTFKGWNRVSFKGLLRYEKFEIRMDFKDHLMVLKADKTALFNNQKILEIEFNSDPYLIIWSGKERSYLSSITPWGNYKFFVEYLTDPWQYSLTVLEDEIKLISLLIDNIHTEEYFDFSAKMNSLIFPKYSNLSLYFYTDYKIPNEFQFTLHNGPDSLLAMSYRFQLEEERYLVVLDFRSVIEALQALSISFHFEPQFLLQFEASKTQYDAEKLYEFIINLPLKTGKAEFEVEFPWENEYCSSSLLLKRDEVDFNLQTPFKDWKKIAFKAAYVKGEDFVTGTLKLQQNNAYGDAKWSYGFNKDEAYVKIDTKNSFGKEPSGIGYIFVDAKYVYESGMFVTCKLDELGNTFDLLFNAESPIIFMKTKLIIPSLNNNVDLSVSLTLYENIEVSLVDGDIKILTFSANKAAKDRTFVGKIDFDLFDSYYFYRAHFTGVFETPTSVLITSFDSKTMDYVLGFDVKSQVNTETSMEGNITVVLRKGWEFDKPSIDVKNYELVWWSVNSEELVLAKMSFEMDKYLTYAYLLHSSERNKFRSELTLSCGGKDLNLELVRTFDSQTSCATLTLRTPLKELNELKAETTLTKGNEISEIRNVIFWPDQQKLTLDLIVRQGINSSAINVQFSSPFNEPLKTELGYRLRDGNIEFSADGSLGQQNIVLKSTIIPESYLTVDFRSPFVGYTSLNLTMYLDRNARKARVYFEKETMTLDFVGLVKALDSKKYEISLTANRNDVKSDDHQNLGNVLLKLDTNSMKGSAEISWKNLDTQLGLSYDPKSLVLELNSPFESIRNVRLQGKYVHHDYSDVRALQINGMWNKIAIDFQGSVLVEDNNFTLTSQVNLGGKYKGALNFYSVKTHHLREISFDSYFPSRESNVVLMFLSEKLKVNSKSRILILTPFDKFKKVSAEAIANKNSIDSKVEANVLDQTLKSDFKLKIYAPSRVEGTLKVELPQSESKFEVETKVDAFNDGQLNVVYQIQNNVNKLTINYEKASSVFKLGYLSNGTKAKTHHTIEVRSLSPYNVSLVLDDCKFSYQLVPEWSNLKLSLRTNIQRLDVNNYAWPSPGSKDRFIEARIFNEPSRSKGNLSVSFDVAYFQLDQFYGEYERTKDGYLLKSNFTVIPDLWLNTTLTYVNNKNAIGLTSWTRQTSSEPFATNFYIGKSMNKIVADVQDVFSLDVINEPTVSRLHALIKGPTKHKLLIDFTQDNFDFALNSPIIEQRNVKINIQRRSYDTSKSVQFSYSEKNLRILEGVMNFRYTKRSADNEEYLLTLNTLKHNQSILEFSGKILITNVTQGLATVNILNTKNHAYFLMSPSDPYMAGLTIGSPFLPYGGFTLETGTSITSSSIFVFAGTGPSDLLEKGFIHLESHQKYILFEARREGDSKIFVKYEAPAVPWLKLIDIQAEMDFNENGSKFSESFRIESDYTDNILISSKFVLEDHLLTEVDLEVPFITALSRFQAELLVPFEFSDDFNPKIFLGLPTTNYSAHVMYKRERNQLVLSGGYQCANRKFNTIFHVTNTPTPGLFAEVILPYKDFNFALSLKIPNDFVTENEVHNYLIVSKTKFELRYSVLFQRNRQLLKAVLVSTIASHEKISLHLEHQSDQEKALKALVYHPALQRECGFDFSILYRSLKDFKLNTLISLPIQIRGFNYAEFVITHNLNLKNKNKNHSLKYFSRFNNFNSSIDLDAALTSDSVLFKISTDVGGKAFYINLKSIGSIFNNFDFLVELQSTLEVIRALKLFLSSSINLNRGLHTGIVYNSEEIATIEFTIGNGEIFLKFDSIWRSVLAEYRYSYIEDLEARARICWDANYPEVSQFGGHVLLGKNFSLGLILPTRIMSIDTEYFIDEHNEYYFGQISWYKGKAVSLTLSFVNVTLDNTVYLKSSAKIGLPFRTFEVTDEVRANFEKSAEVKSKFTLKWDEDERSRIYVQNHILPGELESRLFLPSLDHEIIVKVDIASLAKIPSHLKAHVEYSNDPDKRIEIGMFYNKSFTNVFHTERLFVLKHPASKIDYALCFSTTRTPEYTVGNITLRYMNYLLNRHEHIRSSLKIGHERFEVAGEIETSKNYLSASGLSISGPSFQGFQLGMRVNEQEPLSVEGIYNFKPAGSSISLSTSSGSNRMYNFYAGLPSKREITAKLAHELYGNEITDALFTLKLNSSQILWLKLNWKYKLLPQFQSAILEEYNDLKYIVEGTGQQLIDVIDDDVGQRLISDVSELHKNFTISAKEEAKSLGKDYHDFLDDVKEGYRSNSFFCKDAEKILKLLFPNLDILDALLINPIADLMRAIYHSVTFTFEDIFSSIHNICSTIQAQVELSLNEVKNVKNLKSKAKEILKKGINDARKSLKEMDAMLNQLLTNADEYFSEIKRECEEFFEPYLKLLDDFVIYVEQRLAALQILVLEMLDTIQHYILRLRESRELMKIYTIYVNWLEEFHLTEILEPIGDVIETILETLITDFKKVMDDYKSYVDSISAAIFGNYHEINKLPPITEFREIINSIYQRTLWIWNYHNLTEAIKNNIRKFVTDFDDYLASLLELDNGNDFEDILGHSDYVIRPDMGIIEITQPLPIEWDAFDEMPYFEQYPLYQKIMKRTENLIQIQRHHFLDLITTINNYVGESPVTLLSPQANNIAMIVGKSHYITFDKKYYNFAGECSYLLASDFITKTFSVIVNYEMDKMAVRKKSVTIIADGNTVEIYPDSGVKLNDENVVLPMIIGSLSVVRENFEIFVDNGKGLKVTCNVYHDYCSVELSGWLFGKTGGLLGTLDNEKVTDMSLPGGGRTSDVLEFVQSWQVGTSKCKNINHANDTTKTNISPLSTTLFETLCQVFFVNANSPLGHCFNSIDPKPFYEMCVNNMKHMTNPTLCSSVAAYRAQCQGAAILVDMPEMCVHCKHGVGLNEDIFDGDNPKSIDVVIIKESVCFDSGYDFVSLPIQIDAALKAKGFHDNQFGVVGYGSAFKKPFIYSAGRTTWTYAENAPMTIKINASSNVHQEVSGIDAIKFSSNLDFRPGVSKIFVLMQCHNYTDIENLNNLHNMFAEKDITLHVLKTNYLNEPDEKLMEMDSRGHVLYVKRGFNVQNFKDRMLNATIMEQIPDQITDVYSLLALSTNGTVLSMDNHMNYTHSDIVIPWSKVISQTIKTSPCQKCRCLVNSDGTGKTECTRCMSPTVKQLLSEYESNVMEFHVDQVDDDYV